MKTERFPIGFWNYCGANNQHPEDVKDWADCGITLTMSAEFNPNSCDKANFLATLDAAHAQGIKVIVCDSRGRFHGASEDEAAFRARFAQALEDFGSHPAVYGFHVGDEPFTDTAIADAKTAYRIEKEMAPHLTPYLNHMPYFPGVVKQLCPGRRYDDFLVDFAKEANLDLFSYDCYAQMNEGDAGVEQYFSNLKVFSNAALKAGIPLWNTVLSVGHFKYRCPSEDDLRWQFFTSIASGCRAVMWFFFYMREPHVNYRIAPIDEHGERTSTYTSMSRIHRTFLKREAQVMNELTLDRVYHVNRAYGGFERFFDYTDPLVATIESSDSTPMIYSVYHNAEGQTYFSVVNNSPKESLRFDLTANAQKLMRVDFGPKETQIGGANDFADTHSTSDGSTIHITSWLAPGQMELYRVIE